MKPKNKQTRETLIFISYPSPLKKNNTNKTLFKTNPKYKTKPKKKKKSTTTTTQILDFSYKVTMYIYRTNKYIYTH